MSHHLSGPDLKSPSDDARLDLSDVYVFLAPNGKNTVLIMNANPDFGGQAPAYHPDAVYRVNVDTNGDSDADIAFSYVFSDPAKGQQTVTVYRSEGDAAKAHEPSGQVIFKDVPVTFGPVPEIHESGPYRFFCGVRSDAFFADLEGISQDFKWTGRDTMANMNIFSTVLEMPNEELGPDPKIGVWARISLYRDGKLVSIDHGAHSSVTAYFNETNDAKNAYNLGEPRDDWATYLKPWSAVLDHTGHYSAEDAERTLRDILPDVLRFDRSKPAAYPNGRTPTDDVTDIRLQMVSNKKIMGDGISAHTDLLPDFPYLGHPHKK